MTEYEQLTIRSRAEWRGWLKANHGTASGIWLVRFKKGRGPHVAYSDVVEEALAFGWVDSQPRRLDDDRAQLLVTRRRKGSRWSEANKTRIADLRQRGLMTPAGEAAVQRAHQDGTWDALDPVEAVQEPEDLRHQLAAFPAARRHWDAFPPPPAEPSSNGSWRPSNPPHAPSASPKLSRRPRSTSVPTSGASPAGNADHPAGHAGNLPAPRASGRLALRTNSLDASPDELCKAHAAALVEPATEAEATGWWPHADPLLRAAAANAFQRWGSLLKEALVRLQEQGELRPDADPAVSAMRILSALQGGMLVAHTLNDVAPLVESLCRLLDDLHTPGR